MLDKFPILPSDVFLICLFWNAFQPPRIHSCDFFVLEATVDQPSEIWKCPSLLIVIHSFAQQQLISRDGLGASSCSPHRGAPVIVYFSDTERMCLISYRRQIPWDLNLAFKKNLFTA